MFFYIKINNVNTLINGCRYFVDSEVLDRVPSLFLLLGGIWATMELISIVFIRAPTKEELLELNKVKRY